MIKLSLTVGREQAEIVLSELLELVPNGVEELDDGGPTVQYALYGAPGELPELPDLRAAAGGGFVEVSTVEIPDDWDERWKRFHEPVLIEPEARAGEAGSSDEAQHAAAAHAAVPALYVRAPWQPRCEIAGAQEIVIEPARAFGTGAHHTTRMTLSLLLELAATGRRGPLLDVGTGSGVLAIAAARLGFGPILALDSERESVQAAEENARTNGVQIDVRRQDIRSSPPEAKSDSAMLANLVRALLVALADGLTQPPAHLLASGLLRAETDEIVARFRQRHGMSERRRLESGEWAAVWLAVDG